MFVSTLPFGAFPWLHEVIQLTHAGKNELVS